MAGLQEAAIAARSGLSPSLPHPLGLCGVMGPAHDDLIVPLAAPGTSSERVNRGGRLEVESRDSRPEGNSHRQLDDADQGR